jgi:hypothetical protein
VMRALEKDQKRRFTSAGSMMEECQSVLTALSTGPFRVGTPPAIGTPGGFAPGPPPLAPMSGHGPPPPMPAPGRPYGANMPTVLDAPALRPMSGIGHPPHISPSSAAAAAQKTVLVNSVGHMDMLQHPTPMPVPGGGKTIMLPNSEGIVSMREATPVPIHALERSAPIGQSASALFWIFCLLTGLAVGVGAYWLVLELGN